MLLPNEMQSSAAVMGGGRPWQVPSSLLTLQGVPSDRQVITRFGGWEGNVGS